MSDEDEDEGEEQPEITQQEWDAFWRSLERYQTPLALRDKVFRQANELWADASPRFNTPEQAYIAVQNGEFRANMAGHVLVTALAHATFQATLNSIFNENILAELSEELQAHVDEGSSGPSQQLRPERECGSCGAVFDPGMNVCPECGEEL